MASLRVSGATITKKKDSFILEFETAAQVHSIAFASHFFDISYFYRF